MLARADRLADGAGGITPRMILWQFSAQPCSSSIETEGWPAFAGTQMPDGRATGYVSQPAHAELAGELAAALLPEVFGELGSDALEAIRGHDGGWAEPDLEALQQVAHGEPASFVAVTPERAIGAWRRSIREAEERSPLAGAVTARHFDLLAPDDAAHAEFRSREAACRVERERAAGLDGAEVAQIAAALGYADLLSLLLCAGYRGRVRLPLAHPADGETARSAESVTLELGDDAVRSSRPLFRSGSRVTVRRWRRGNGQGELHAESAAWALGELMEEAGHTRREDDERWMRAALEQARQGEQTPGGAQVGAVLVRGGEALCRGFNEGEGRHDPTAHAEMVVIRRLCAELETTSLRGCTIFCTLQPCGMCTAACLWAGVSRIVYGAGRGDVHAVYFESRHWDTTDVIAESFRSDLEVTGGVLAEECAAFYAKPAEPVDVEADPAHGATVRAS